MINEHDIVALKTDKPEYVLQAGTSGTIVSVYRNGEAFLVEFSGLDGKDVQLIDLTIDDVHKGCLPTKIFIPIPQQG